MTTKHVFSLEDHKQAEQRAKRASNYDEIDADDAAWCWACLFLVAVCAVAIAGGIAACLHLMGVF